LLLGSVVDRTHKYTQSDIEKAQMLITEISSSHLTSFGKQRRLKETSLLMCHTSEQFIADLTTTGSCVRR
jgi:hypothetical protein